MLMASFCSIEKEPPGTHGLIVWDKMTMTRLFRALERELSIRIGSRGSMRETKLTKIKNSHHRLEISSNRLNSRS